MKKYFVLLGLCLFTSIAIGQNTDSILRDIQNEEIIEKVKKHDDFYQRILFLMPGLIVLSAVGLFGIGWSIWLHFKGIQNKVNATISSKENQLLIQEQINKYFETKTAAEEKKRLAEEQRIKSKAVYLVFHLDRDQKGLCNYLENKGFKTLHAVSIKEKISPKPNDVVIFVNDSDKEQEQLSTEQIENFGNQHSKKAKFLYYGKRWQGNLKMSQFSNNKETLVPRLLELLSS